MPAAGLWLELSVLRGVLQGIGDYKGVGVSLVGEQAARLVVGVSLAAVGAGVAGAYWGTPVSFVAMCMYCGWRLKIHIEAETGESLRPRAQLPPAALSLWTHVRRAWAPICGLIIIAVLQNIDIIGAKHRFTTSLASSYSAVAVAGKVLIWVAIGAGFYLVPEVSRLHSEGKDPRPILARALGIVGVCAIPVLLIYAFASHILIKAVFGADKAQASSSLLVLGLAFTALSCTYLAIQYLLALHRKWFLVPMALVAIAEPILLLNAPTKATGFAAVVLGVQIVAALVAFAFALAPDRRPPQEQPGDAGRAGADRADPRADLLDRPAALEQAELRVAGIGRGSLLVRGGHRLGLHLDLDLGLRSPARTRARVRAGAADRGPGARGSGRNRHAASAGSTACTAPPPGGRAAAAGPPAVPIVRTSSRPCSREIPVESSSQQLG